MKKSLVCTALCMLAVGFGFGMAAARYKSEVGTSREQFGILTPAAEERKEEYLADGSDAQIFDGEVPLSAGPGMAAGDFGVIEEAAKPAVQENPYIRQVVSLVNEERAKAGLAPLEKSDDVSLAASVRAKELTASFSHTRPDGSAYRTVLEQNGVSYRSCGENVAFGYRTPEAVMSAWMTSEGHKENILNEKYTNIGVGYFKDGSGQGYWAQIFTVGK